MANYYTETEYSFCSKRIWVAFNGCKRGENEKGILLSVIMKQNEIFGTINHVLEHSSFYQKIRNCANRKLLLVIPGLKI